MLVLGTVELNGDVPAAPLIGQQPKPVDDRLIAWLVLNEDIREHERPFWRGEFLDTPIQDVADIADVIPHPGREFSHAINVKDGEHELLVRWLSTNTNRSYPPCSANSMSARATVYLPTPG
ncbi:MAG: hypothetical protein ACR2JU_17070 [Nocardioidaceae bacterium]